MGNCEKNDCYELLRGTTLAVELTDTQCKILSEIIYTRTLADGDVLIKEGSVDNSLHVIIQGELAVTKETGADGGETLTILKPGELAGAMGFIDGLDHSATLRSIGETHIFSLERDKFESLLDTHPVIVYRVMRAITRSIHAIVRRMNTQYVELTNYITKQRGRY